MERTRSAGTHVLRAAEAQEDGSIMVRLIDCDTRWVEVEGGEVEMGCREMTVAQARSLRNKIDRAIRAASR